MKDNNYFKVAGYTGVEIVVIVAVVIMLCVALAFTV